MSLIRILYVNGGLMNRGGIESYMMNYYRHFDRTKIQIDFIVHDAGGYGYYDDEIKKMGGNIFVLPQKSKHPFTYTSKLKRILKKNDYKIIHTHMDAMGAWVLKTAKQCGIPVRIAHSHNTQHLSTNPIKLFFLEQARKNINRYATHRMACSEAAGKWLFKDAPFQIIRNAIDIDKFLYNPESREKIRRKWSINQNDFLIGHIGRFDTQKNHSFLIDVFKQVHQKCPQCKLMLVGEGRLMHKIKAKVEQLNLKESVIFTGSRNDVNLFYNAFDLFVLPSLFEGLGIVAIEAEVNGCPVILSNYVPLETQIVSNALYIPLKTKKWSNYIEKNIKQKNQREPIKFAPLLPEYNITTAAKKLQSKYLELYKMN